MQGAAMTTHAEIPTASAQITIEVTSWPGIRTAHFFFPKSAWHQLHDAARIVEHPVFPGRIGPAARRIESQADIQDVIAMMRLNYDRFTAWAPPAAAASGGRRAPR
jgi:hypothetical protein